MVCHHIQVTPD